jgi:hypothetical protein
VEQPIRELYFSIYTPAKLLYCNMEVYGHNIIQAKGTYPFHYICNFIS